MNAYYFAVEAVRQLSVKELREIAEYCISLADQREGEQADSE